MLERQSQVERIKGVLAMLKRYESLFRLPTRIRCLSNNLSISPGNLWEQIQADVCQVCIRDH